MLNSAIFGIQLKSLAITYICVKVKGSHLGFSIKSEAMGNCYAKLGNGKRYFLAFEISKPTPRSKLDEGPKGVS